jgi:hypothetical protein
MKRTIILLLLFAGTSTGCSYLEARGRDFLGCFRCTVGAGVGAHASIQIGPLGYGVGLWEGYEAGLQGDWGFQASRSSFYSSPFPLWLVTTPLYTKWKWDPACGCGYMPFAHYHHALWLRNPGKKKTVELQKGMFLFCIKGRGTDEGNYAAMWDSSWADPLWIEVSLHCMVGVRVGFNPAEFVDFLLGWFGLDILNDDDGHYLRVLKSGKNAKPILEKEGDEDLGREDEDREGK